MRRKCISLVLMMSLLFQQTGFIYAVGELDISSYLSRLSGAVVQDINKELIEINNLIQSGNIPSPERLGEDIGYCLYKDRLSAYKDDIDLSLMGVGRLKEEYGLEMGKEYLRILFLMHSIVNPFESESYLSED